MAIRDLLKKKDKINETSSTPASGPEIVQDVPATSSPPEFKFFRSTTSMQESIEPPTYPEDSLPATPPESSGADTPRRRRISALNFRKPSRSPAKSTTANDTGGYTPSSHDGTVDKSRRISEKFDRMRLSSRNRTVSQNSAHVPEDLPEIEKSGREGSDAEAQWEQRALLLANKNAQGAVGLPSGARDVVLEKQEVTQGAVTDGQAPERPKHTRSVSNPESDLDIQEAITLHEAGELEKATSLFKRLASPNGQNNALAQVMYGLSLRHGWGCEVSPAESLKYISLAASNSASVEAAALSAGKNKGGAAKGELVLAIFELANSFRSGFGCEKDPVAARRYYETAAELGDTDAMLEVADCYLKGYGGKKDKKNDKLKAAKYLRMAENKGIKEPGNSWIWKEKYNEPSPT